MLLWLRKACPYSSPELPGSAVPALPAAAGRVCAALAPAPVPFCLLPPVGFGSAPGPAYIGCSHHPALVSRSPCIVRSPHPTAAGTSAAPPAAAALRAGSHPVRSPAGTPRHSPSPPLLS